MNSILAPFSIGSLELSNRVLMAPMTRNMSPGNVPTDNVVEYYRQRAAGGVGLIITEGTCVGHKSASGYPDVPLIAGEEALAGWKKVVDAVHAEGGKIAPQLWHVGGIRRPGVEPGGDTPGYSPSGMAFPGKVTGHAMTKQDIDEVVESFVQAAVDAERIGFDAIEIHGAHGYLLDQFFWPGTNHRDDEYGGSLENRSRFACEIVRGIRAKVAADFPIIFRFSQWKQQDYTAKLAESPDELKAFLQPLVDAGVDIFHCSTRRFWEPEFEGSDLNLAGWTKQLTGKPTITVGSVSLNADFLPEPGDQAFKDGEIASLDNLIQRLDAQEFDLVAVGRALIANPDWAHKVRDNALAEMTPFNKKMLAAL
ncbi:NADH:flavin oxidoreductase [Arenicella xantha]|uniref:2,4-dienoyl-CoA reductase-like NADH-dependent reductase (Old Yellow Enzyme family) n=1 Tax=Arenicella xantha TaxID=644221 RepID=A0A395JKL1_9GAMM|nr:NADH:flavin oxidoreductase [Arenicella xantha]RBP49731.1 2,4-dienoyl-CoA reductase-like NADH-dependent reductase (Old Yellow Enzyme family) [Arenicella xantha]